jgi:hypothetical protein
VKARRPWKQSVTPKLVDVYIGRGGVSGRWSLVLIIAKNALAVGLVVGVFLALSSGYFSPDRPSRDQWARLVKAKQAKSGPVVYQSRFDTERPGERHNPTGHWGMYNGATVSTVTYDPGGVTVKYGGVAWIGAAFHLDIFEPQRIYRVTIEREVEGEPAALIVRNRQMDLERAQIPVGSGPFATEFLAPLGRFDRIVMAFVPDGTSKPQGSIRITSLRIELMEDGP